ncbi:helix-turn-helix domain-containing protein [Neomoorella thermoacetica]|uniref:HTH-type transcriptional regulator SinR n=2 Tax=Neomoorella thermoacetica TaxID=1525 RepID=A0A1J5NA12_NEOTH|nr:helix-turn-helix transcriptional regulator [Moorella thermoacetica]AKX94426.1 HTH-type transcriptional regulator SinR [Moorella thermoacetica]AKX97062.1 HTH-type transcriptional regulator SinR [Moorella thermoacetica]APC08824.1 HTH-type transcriptional regulator SinR [Moorella thermoacetica]OIQ08445.1 HTH-type transcriptional regulator SinR [Moorella thermoacetica]OIQ55232.1 HTH-type transcriptional regulator SinR [Moorella thermoacetica]
MTIGEKLKKLREDRGIPLEELADRLDIAPACMVEVEQGTRRLSLATLKEVAAILGVDVSYFQEENDNKNDNSVGARLRRLREQKGITLSELSRRSGVSLAHISEIERSRSTASLKTLEKLAAVLEVSTSSLLRSGQQDSLGAKLKRLREKIGLTQKELAQQVGISHSLIGQIETDRIQPSLSTLSSLAEALGVSTCYFLMEDDEEDLYLDYRLEADIREALRRPLLQQVVRDLAGWSDREIKGLLDFVSIMNEARRPLNDDDEEEYQEIKDFIRRSKEEERNLVANLIGVLNKKHQEDGV